MALRTVLALLALLVGASLVGAPVTMADWGQQASHHVEPVDADEVDDEVPVLQYESLSPAAQNAVLSAIQSPDNQHTVYGREDFPEEFFYSDYAAPGQGVYVIEYEGQQYRLQTFATGGFPFVYWVMELPFVVYGLLLGLASVRLERGDEAPATGAVAAAIGVGLHLHGPELDFPLLTPDQFVALGIGAAALLGAWLARGVLPASWRRRVRGS